MIQDIFLAYANNSLKGNPENLYKIFDVIRQNIDLDLSHVDDVIRLICELSQYNDPRDFLSAFEKYKVNDGYTDIEWKGCGAVTGPRFSYYQELWFYHEEFHKERFKKFVNCELRQINKKMLGGDHCEDGYTQKCYGCYQIKFLSLLQGLIAGKEYSEIENIDKILDQATQISTRITTRDIGESNQNNGFKEILITHDFYELGFDKFMDSQGIASHNAFSKYLNSIVFFSLTEFLLHNDRRKLKRCEECGKFYISKTLHSSRFCSDKCRLAWNNRRRIESGEAREYKRVERAKGKYQ